MKLSKFLWEGFWNGKTYKWQSSISGWRPKKIKNQALTLQISFTAVQVLLSLLPPLPRGVRRCNKLHLLHFSHTIYTAHVVEHIITSLSNAVRGVVAKLLSTLCSFGFILVTNIGKTFFCCRLLRLDNENVAM